MLKLLPRPKKFPGNVYPFSYGSNYNPRHSSAYVYSEESVSLLGFLTENTWGEPHRGVGALPSQLIIPGNPIPSRDEALPLATGMEPLPGLPFTEATCNQCSVASQVVGSAYFLPPPNNGITGWLLCPPSIYMDSGDPHSRLYA